MIEGGCSGAPLVLLVDDEGEVLASQADLLRKEFRTLATTEPAEALQLLQARDVTLLLTDQRMPGMNGTELLARAAVLSPTTVRVLITAYSDIGAVIDAINQGKVFCYLSKPWEPEKLLAVARGAASAHGLATEERRLLAELQRIVAEGEPAPEESLAGGCVQREVEVLSRSVERLHEVFENLRQIGEILPVCLSCGRIKTGEARWEAAMEYLRKHSRNLSHGYCPECVEKVRAEWKLKPGKP